MRGLAAISSSDVPGPSSRDRQADAPVRAPGRDLDAASGGPRRDRVDDGILDERLEREGRDRDAQRRLVRLHLQAQPRTQPHALEIQVAPDELPLPGERHPVASGLLHPLAETQELAQALERLLGEGRVAAHEAQQRVQHVQHEVRMELRAQERELGARAQDGGARLPLVGLA